MKLEVIPAILVKTREDLLDHISRVRVHVKTIHIDVMDNKFVPNSTIGTKELQELPTGLRYEMHWMVQKPEEWIAQVKKGCSGSEEEWGKIGSLFESRNTVRKD